MDLDWDNLGFGFMPTDYMYIMKCSQGKNFTKGELQRFGNIELSPSAGILNYGQVNYLTFVRSYIVTYFLNLIIQGIFWGIIISLLILQGLFEGLKAYRKHDGHILLFRPEENALRMKMGAERMCMPSPTVEQFLEAVKATVLANERWV